MSSEPDPQKHTKIDEPCEKRETEEKRNEIKIPLENTSFGMVPWNGMMLPFFYIWNTPQ